MINKILQIALFGICQNDEDRVLLSDLFTNLRKGEEEGYFKIYLHKKMSYLGDSPVFDKVLPANTDVLLSIGGDGTLLDTLPLVRDSGVKVMGVNMGTLGFLSGADRKEIKTLVTDLRLRKYKEEKRCLLEITAKSDFSVRFPYAMNEIAVFKCDTSSLISINVKIDGKLLNKYYGDGVIFSTATGSTAYSLSCGGPIIVPEMEALLITPVASHTLTVRPILLPISSKVEVEVENNIDFKLSADSDIETIKGPFSFQISQAPFSLSTLRLLKHDFFSTLRQKLMWGADGRRQQS